MAERDHNTTEQMRQAHAAASTKGPGMPTKAKLRAFKQDLLWSSRVLGIWSLAALAWRGLGDATPLAGLRSQLAAADHLVPGIDQRVTDLLVVLGDRSFDANTLAIAIVVVIWAMALAVVFTTLLRAEDAKAEADAEYEFYETSIEDDEDDDDTSEGMPGRRLLH